MTRRAVGYVRVSTGGQAESGAGLEVQRSAVIGECERRSWDLVELVEDAGVSGGKLERPGLDRALAMVRSGAADVLVVYKVDRLSRSLADFASTLAGAHREGWQLVCLDLGVDTTTPNGKFMAQIMGAVAELEREMISARTKAALAVKKAEGVRIGRPRAVPAEVRERISRERAAGASLRAIADGLDGDGVPTGHGGARWHASTVRAVLAGG